MLTPCEIEFITENEAADTARLLLNTSKQRSSPAINIPLCVKCIEARRKIASKIPLWHKNKALVYPFPLSVEQCSSQATALYKQKLVSSLALSHPCNIADMTAGMGVDSYFLSLIAAHHYYIERNAELCAASQYNFTQLGACNIQVLNRECLSANTDLFSFMKDKQLSILYIDPARRSKTNSKVISLQDYEPNILELKEQFFRLAPYLLIKVSPMADIKLNLKLLPEVTQVHVVSVDNECKEVLFLLRSPATTVACAPASSATVAAKYTSSSPHPTITAANITARGEQYFTFTLPEEENAPTNLTNSIGTYLFEPSKSILKSGAYKLVAERFGLQKLAPSTHLYTSNALCPSFPGKTFT
ncbi:MAG: SAM-dependent methyltransferase, partial [Bacteroidales bacterium]